MLVETEYDTLKAVRRLILEYHWKKLEVNLSKRGYRPQEIAELKELYFEK